MLCISIVPNYQYTIKTMFYSKLVLEQANEAQSSLLNDLQEKVQTLQQRLQGLDYVQLIPKAEEPKKVMSCEEVRNLIKTL